MIQLRTVNDVLNGIIDLYDNSNLSDTFTRALLELPSLGLSEELNAGSTPTISAFLSPNSLSKVSFSARVDEVLIIKYTLLSPVDPSGLSYTLGDNLVYKTGIYNLFSGTDRISIADILYIIDKSYSTADMLFLTSPIMEEGTVYKAYYLEKCVTVIYEIPIKLKDKTFNYDSCCDCNEGKTLSQSYLYLEAIKVQEECNDCEKQKLLLNKLKDALDIC